MRLPVKPALGLATLILLGSGALAAADDKDRPELARTGPAADYPLVIGEPFTIGTTVWTPNDQLNYDAVGMASVGEATLVGVSGAHKTLPLPSYVEVTSLNSGRTILVRLERRGPMVNSLLIELSPAAAQQLGMAPGASDPVRVRRVNPPEAERALLRQGEEAPLRMDTPQGLLNVLRKKLAEQSPLLPPPSTPPTPPQVTSAMLAGGQSPSRPAPAPAPSVTVHTAPTPVPPPAKPVENPPAPVPAAAPPAKASPAAIPVHRGTPPAEAAKGAYVVQVGAFSAEANARKLAKTLGGFVVKPGQYWLVRIGPFSDRAKATPALEKARKAGYRDARIRLAD